MDDEWYDDYHCLEEEAFMNTIWEECTADLVSKSSVDFTSFNSDFTSFNSISSQHVFDRQDSESTLFSLQEEPTTTERLSSHGKEEDDEGELDLDHQHQPSSSSSCDDDDVNDVSSSHIETEVPHQRLEAECRRTSTTPRTSASSSSQGSLSNEPPIADVLLSPRSPLEIHTVQMVTMDKQPSETSHDDDDDDDEEDVHYSCSRRIDFSGTIIEHKTRELKRERIRSKMKAIEEKMVQARVILNVHYNDNRASE